MRHVNPWPDFSETEIDDLRKKIVHGITEDWAAAGADHLNKAAINHEEWVVYPCWLSASKWQDGKGFKKFKFRGHSIYIHRASYEVFNGPVKEGQIVDHLCRVRGCCQPMHLEAVTHKENILRGRNPNHLLRNGSSLLPTTEFVEDVSASAPPLAPVPADVAAVEAPAEMVAEPPAPPSDIVSVTKDAGHDAYDDSMRQPLDQFPDDDFVPPPPSFFRRVWQNIMETLFPR